MEDAAVPPTLADEEDTADADGISEVTGKNVVNCVGIWYGISGGFDGRIEGKMQNYEAQLCDNELNLCEKEVNFWKISSKMRKMDSDVNPSF